MKQNWAMLTIIGRDSSGIVADISKALFENDCNLGEASMVRLGGNFTIMMMVQSDKSVATIQQFMSTIASQRGLNIHVDAIDASLHQHKESDVIVRVYGADRAAIIAQVTEAMAVKGLNILDLMSDVGGSDEEPFYMMTINGQAEQGVEALEKVAKSLSIQGIDVRVDFTPMLLA